MPRLLPPENGVAVRMYRIGHGDCFLFAFPRKGGGEPVYVLIDCGYKPGSPAFIPTKVADIIDNIAEATNKILDLVIITHEHQDHLNAIWKANDPYFGRFTIKEAWMAWTENPADALANRLRERHKDTLLQLVEARRKLALAAGPEDISVRRVDALLGLELGGENEVLSEAAMFGAASDPEKSVNKQGLRLIKRKADENRGVQYLSPKDRRLVPDTDGVRAFVLGPPRSETLLRDEDPVGAEGFPTSNSHRFTFGAAAAAAEGTAFAPFSSRYVVRFALALNDPNSFFADHYGKESEGRNDTHGIEVPRNADWRRIDNDWLFSAENLALQLNVGINNTSLVLAFELPRTKKVLLFVGDAQRGNWTSWKDVAWKDGNETITTRDLLARTVLYKVGHHGSHNATLHGKLDDTYANLSWMATGPFAGEFTAMITAVNKWALTQNDPPWRHPLPSIKEALKTKAQGRVFQTDEDHIAKPATVQQGEWNRFLQRANLMPMYFDYVVHDG